jgi:hypothetical protein
MGSIRAIKRNKARAIVKKNRYLKDYWRSLMIEEKGLINYMVEYKKTTGRSA